MPSRFAKIEMGEVFGRWTVIGLGEPNDSGLRMTCRCSCGAVREVLNKSLRSGNSKSCGCARDEILRINRQRGTTNRGRYGRIMLKHIDGDEADDILGRE